MITHTDVINEIASIFEIQVSDIIHGSDRLSLKCRRIFAYVCYEKLDIGMNAISRILKRGRTYGINVLASVKIGIEQNRLDWICAFDKYKKLSLLWHQLNANAEPGDKLNIIPRDRKVSCIETGIEYESIQQASSAVNIKYSTLYKQLTGINKNKTTLILK